MTACGHGPFCRECMAATLTLQVHASCRLPATVPCPLHQGCCYFSKGRHPWLGMRACMHACMRATRDEGWAASLHVHASQIRQTPGRAAQGGDAAEGSCPICRGGLTPARVYSRAQLRALAPAPIDLASDDEEGTPPEDGARVLVSSTKLDNIVAALEWFRACAFPPSHILMYFINYEDNV